MNGDSNIDLFNANIPINVNTYPTGLTYQNVFASEFGCVSMSSFESMAPTLAKEHWALHAGQPADSCPNGFEKVCTGDNVMAQRNYPCDNIIQVYFGAMDLNVTGEYYFKKALWQCMIGQALNIKSNIETRRSGNQFGTLVWQYGEIWPTGGWGSIEYATPRPGQVIGGRWKPLHHWYARSIYTDVMATCGSGGQCYVRNDRSMQPFGGSVVVSAIEFATGAVSTLHSATMNMPAGPGITQLFNVNLTGIDGSHYILNAQVIDERGSVVSNNDIALLPPVNFTLPATTLSVSVANTANPDGSVDVTVTTNAVSVYTTLTTLAQGRFDDNAFVLVPPSRTIRFVPFGPLDLATLKASIRVEDVATYRAM